MEKRCISTLSICLSTSLKETKYCRENPNENKSCDTGKKHENPTIHGKEASQHPIHIAWQVNVCKPKKVHLFPFNIN